MSGASYAIQVELDHGDIPKRIRYLGQWHRILNCRPFEEVLKRWYKKEVEVRVRYRCTTYQGLKCDLCKDGDVWVMEVLSETRQIK